MQKVAYMPESPKAARAKLREGLADWWHFIVSAPCLAACWVFGKARIARIRLCLRLRREPARAIAVAVYWIVFSLIPTLGFYLSLFF